MEYILTIIIVILFAYIVYVDRQRHHERKDLLNRIMAENYREYAIEDRAATTPPKGRSSSNLQKNANVPDHLKQYMK